MPNTEVTMTQEEVDDAFNETKALWEQMKKESGKSALMFMSSKEGTRFLGEFEVISERVRALGLTIKPLEETATVTIH